jgi:hypothetical protein
MRSKQPKRDGQREGVGGELHSLLPAYPGMCNDRATAPGATGSAARSTMGVEARCRNAPTSR